jgi:hypothetical protein
MSPGLFGQNILLHHLQMDTVTNPGLAAVLTCGLLTRTQGSHLIDLARLREEPGLCFDNISTSPRTVNGAGQGGAAA